jgi:nuclear cap-binding protein subunit 2
MGLNNKTFKPCGFCFVEYHTREEARLAIDCFNLFLFDAKRIRIDWDYGFQAKRQFGRGRAGGQVRDEQRTNDK